MASISSFRYTMIPKDEDAVGNLAHEEDGTESPSVNQSGARDGKALSGSKVLNGGAEIGRFINTAMSTSD